VAASALCLSRSDFASSQALRAVAKRSDSALSLNFVRTPRQIRAALFDLPELTPASLELALSKLTKVALLTNEESFRLRQSPTEEGSSDPFERYYRLGIALQATASNAGALPCLQQRKRRPMKALLPHFGVAPIAPRWGR
jgi:hypothetical protein